MLQILVRIITLTISLIVNEEPTNLFSSCLKNSIRQHKNFATTLSKFELMK